MIMFTPQKNKTKKTKQTPNNNQVAEKNLTLKNFSPTFLEVLVWFVGFYGISTFVGYLTPNPFLCKSVLFKTIQFSISTQFNCQKHFYFKLFK